MTQGNTIAINVLKNDSDPQGLDFSSVQIEAQPRNGTAALELTNPDTGESGIPTGRVLYTPNPGFTGTDSFTYSVADILGARSLPTDPTDPSRNASTVTISVGVDRDADQLEGGAGADVLVGNSGDDVISGSQGGDSINGNAGNDTLFGGGGNDSIDGGTQNDKIRGNNGNDTLCGGFGMDDLDGGVGDDLIQSVCSTVEPIGIYTADVNTAEPRLPDIVFVVDRSGSTIATFPGVTRDVNGDGFTGTILDGEIQAMLNFQQSFLARNANANVSVVAFDTDSQILDMDPSANVSISTTFIDDRNGNGLSDFIDIILSIRFGAATNYEAALRDALHVFSDDIDDATPFQIPNLVQAPNGIVSQNPPGAVRGLNTLQGNGTLIFLTDGIPNFALGNPPSLGPNRPDPAVFNNGPFTVPIANPPPATINVFGPAGINRPVTFANGTAQSITNLVLPVPPFAANQTFPVNAYVTYADEVSSLVANGVSVRAAQIDIAATGAAAAGYVRVIDETARSIPDFGALDQFVQGVRVNARTADVTVKLSAASDVPVTVDLEVNVAAGTATLGRDYLLDPQFPATGIPKIQVTFAPGEVEKVIPILMVLNDIVAEPNAETVIVTISIPSNPQPQVVTNRAVSLRLADGTLATTLTSTIRIFDLNVVPPANPTIVPLALPSETTNIDVGTPTLIDPSTQKPITNFGPNTNFGPDLLTGGDGNDTLLADRGNDSIIGGAGTDSLFGGSGDDGIFGGTGSDTLDGGAGNDTLDGQGGDDLLIDGVGNNTIVLGNGAGGNDTVDGSDGFNQITVVGTKNADTITVGQLNGSITVTRAGATITGMTNMSVQRVVINALAGDDTVTIQDLSSVLCSALLMVNGGDGNDRITGLGSNLGLVRLELNGDNGNDTILGTNGDDSIDGGAGNDAINGQTGNDFLNGGDGSDTLAGGLGNDTINGDNGNDFLTGQAGDDSLNGGTGADTLKGFEGNDTLVGAAGDDLLNGMDGDDSILGGVGKDMISGGSGNDTLDGGRNDDTINGNSGNDKIRGDHGNDFIDAGTDVDTVNGGDGNDTIIATDGNDLLNGGDGNDRINAGGGNDIVTGGDGNDSLIGGGGNDIILGGDGDDFIDGQTGSDTVAGNQGVDVIVDPVSEINELFTLSAAILTLLEAA